MMRKADDGGIGGVDRSLPETVLIGTVGRCHSYGSVFDGELILSVRCTEADGIIFIQRPRTVRGAVHCGGNKTRIVHKGFVSYEEEGRCQEDARNEVKVFFYHGLSGNKNDRKFRSKYFL